MDNLLLIALMSLFCGIKTDSVADKGPFRTYYTSFTTNENPISEKDNWINGKTNGLDWSDISTVKGHAIGHQLGNVHYLDATALLTGYWNADQGAKATVFVGTTFASDYPEVELRLRSSLSAHNCSGYEIAFSAAGKTTKSYVMLVRWNGPIGDFTVLKQPFGPQYGVSNGDVVKATIIGHTLTAYINNVQVATATDSIYTKGSPGMGFNFDWVGQKSAKGTNISYGFTNFTATDNIINQDF
jgi:hypothetical protein